MAASIAAAVFTSSAFAATTHIVQLVPGENIQQAVNQQPAGTTFVMAAGVYRMQSIQPKSNDVFNGQGVAILNGSELLSFVADASASGLWTAPAIALAPDRGQCQTTSPLCNYPQDLYIDGVPQTPATALAGLAAGQWYFDRTGGNVYIPTNPAGHTVELGASPFAFGGIGSNVVIENLTVEEYANIAQTGAVGWYKDGMDWIVDHVEARFNHGTGIALGSGGQILNSFVHNNGQLGVCIMDGSGSQVVGNQIAWNNYAGYSYDWEAGGSKFWNTVNLLVEDNFVHNNNGPGLWTDYNNVGTVYENNTVEYNVGVGILHEISLNATIIGNTVENNAGTLTPTPWTGQITLANSSGVIVVSNTVEVPVSGGDGIGIVNSPRGNGPEGPWVAANNAIHNNVIIYNGNASSSGIVDYLGNNTAVGNHFDYDHYYVRDGGTKHWTWFNNLTWTGMQGAGQEVHGQCCD
jgi:hypothetical protein